MPDGDIVHKGLKRLQQKPYKMLCEAAQSGVHSDEEIAFEILKKLRILVQRNGDASTGVIRLIAQLLDTLANQTESVGVSDWRETRFKIEDIVRCANIGARTAESIETAAIQQLQSIQWSLFQGTREEVTTEILKKYMDTLYRANFEERVPLNPNGHYLGVAQEAVEHHLATVRPHVSKGIGAFAKQLVQEGSSVTRLRMPARSISRVIDASTELNVLIQHPGRK